MWTIGTDLMRKWWPGLVPLALLWAAAAWTSTGPVETDIKQRAAFALKEAVLDNPRLDVAGRDVAITAAAFSEEGRVSAVGMIDSAPGVRQVRDGTSLVPQVEPYSWSGQREVARVLLRGHAPLPAIRNRLTEAARAAAGGVELADEMAFGRSAPPRFDAAVLLLVEQLGKLKEGHVRLEGTRVSLSGMARELGGRATAWRRTPSRRHPTFFVSPRIRLPRL